MSSDRDELVVPTSKEKLVRLAAGSAGFVLGSAWVALGVGLIPWDQIADLREYEFKRQTLADQPAWKRRAL